MTIAKQPDRPDGRGGDMPGGRAEKVGGVRYDRSVFGSGADNNPVLAQTSGKSAGVSFGREPVSPSVGSSAPRRRLGLQGRFMLFSLLAFVVISFGAWLFLRPTEKVFVLDSYQWTTVQRRDFRGVIVATGTVEPETVTVFTAPVDSRVAEIFVDVGDDVDEGTPLLQLISEKLSEEVDKVQNEKEEALLDLEQARLKTASDVLVKEQELAEAEQALAAALQQLPLTETLFELGGVSAADMQETLAEVERLRARVDNAVQGLMLAERQAALTLRQAEQKARTAERTLAKLQAQLENMTVQAEADGRVLSLSVRTGQLIAAGTELLRHADVTRQLVKTAVTPEQAALLQTGTPAQVRVGGRTLPAVVSFVAPLAQTQGERSAVPVTLSVDPDVVQTVRPFTEVSIELELGVREQRPALPRGPFFASGDAAFVYVISEDGTRAERRDVRYGAIDGNFVEIAAGLEPGDRIVYSSYTTFRTRPTVELIPEGGRPVE